MLMPYISVGIKETKKKKMLDLKISKMHSFLRHKLKFCQNSKTCKKHDSSVSRQAMQWNPLYGIGRRNGRACETWRRTVERECKNLNKTWPDLKQLAQSRVGAVDALCPGRYQGNQEEEEEA